MQAMTYRAYGAPDVLQVTTVPTPAPGAGEVLVQVHAASLNQADLYLLRGEPWVARLSSGLRRPKRPILGADIAGRVVAVGSGVTQFQPGDAVHGDLSACGLGAFAEYVCAREEALAPKPASLSFGQAAAVPMAAVTALQGLRAAAYRAGQHQAEANMAVLVQRLIQADAAGVAFTTNPLTGNREEMVVSAVRGLGERLVSGQASPDEWIVRGAEVVCQVAPEAAITAEQVRAVAELARRVEVYFSGVPQDIEWAIAGGALFLLQARPITALPEHVAWQAPGPGGWARHFRIGEWLGDPVTPLFATWLLPRLDERFWLQNDRLIGIPPRPRPPYALVNGWFFTSISMWTYSLAGTLWALVRNPKALRLAALMSPITARRAAEPFVREWWEVALPRYRALVQAGQARVEPGSSGSWSGRSRRSRSGTSLAPQRSGSAC